MATYDITSNSFDINTIAIGDILTVPYTGDESELTLPAGTYRINITGATGNFGTNRSTTNTTYTSVGGGGSSTGILEVTDPNGLTVYINVGGCGETYTGTSSTVRQGGYNGGGTANYYGGVGGGATHIATRSGLLSSLEDYKDTIIIVAGGGGGSNHYSGNSEYYGNGGSGGGTSGAAGTASGATNTTYAGQGGTQSAGGAAGTNSTRKGTAGSFGKGGNQGTGTSSYSSSAGGGGYYGGGAGSNQEGGGGGGSGYVSTTWLTDASTTQGTNTTTYTNGSVSFTILDLPTINKVNFDLTLSGGNYTSDHTNGTIEVPEGRNETISFIPLSPDDPVHIYKNDVDVTNSATTQTLTSGITVTTTAPGASYGFPLNSSTQYYTSNNKGTAKSAAVARVNITAVERTTVTFTLINYAEEGYDFGVLGFLDTPLEQVYNSDNSGYWSGFSADRNISGTQTVSYTVPVGEHFIDVKYIKDDATNSNNDTLQFKVAMNPAAGDTTKYYTYTTGQMYADTVVKIICGDVTSNFNIIARGAHANIDPENEYLYKGSNYELHFIPTDTEDYRYVGLLDNNADVTNAVVAPHTMANPSFTVNSVSGASYGFTLTDGYYQSQNNSNNTAALCKVIFNTPVPTTVNMTYQNSGNGSTSFSLISELNTDLRTDYATDTSGYQWSGSSNFHSTDTLLSFDIPAGESYIVCKHKIGNSSSNRGNLKFKIELVPQESLEVPYYTYSLTNVQEVHNIIVLSEKIPSYTVTAVAGPMGSISPEGAISVKEGGSITITGAGETNYNIKKIFVNSSSVEFSGNSYTLSNIQSDANVYFLFASENSSFHYKHSTAGWVNVAQVYKKVNGEWVEQDFETVGDPNTKYIRLGDEPTNVVKTAILTPSTYAVSNTQYVTTQNPTNAYGDTDSTTYGRFTHNRSQATTYTVYLRGFDFSEIPNDATIQSFTIRFKAQQSGLSTSYPPLLYNNTTQVTGTASAVTTTLATTEFTGVTATWATIKGYGNNFGIGFRLRRSTTNTSGYMDIYGAEIEVTYI